MEELIATPYRFDGGKVEAKLFFENGMLKTFKQINQYVLPNVPLTIYYAYKQSEDGDNEKSSTGWETRTISENCRTLKVKDFGFDV